MYGVGLNFRPIAELFVSPIYPSSQGYGFSNSHVWLWESDYFLLFPTPSLDPYTDFHNQPAWQGKKIQTANTYSWGEPPGCHVVLLGSWSRLIFMAGLVNLLAQSHSEQRATTSQHRSIYPILTNRIKSIRRWIFRGKTGVIRRSSLLGLLPGHLEYISLFWISLPFLLGQWH